ncbi:MAG: hypothetical protein LBP23_01950, partial [Treponema sp.]|nr:hypothetical protein [Treponema sp.]
MIRTILWAAVCALLLSLQACDTSSGAAALCRIIYQATNADSGAAPAAGIFPAGSMAKVAGNPGAMGRTGAAAGKSWVFVGWNTRPDGTGVDYPVGKRFPIAADLVLYARWKEITSTLLAGKRNFWTLDLVDDSWYTVEAVKLVEESKCIVYADLHAFLTIEENWGQAVADEYEKDTNGIYAKIADGITGVFKNTSNPSKTIEDVDGNGKVIFLLLDIQDGYTGEGGYVAGYFHSYHMYAAGYPYSNSNEADMLFMDVNPATNEGAGGKTFYSTMAHELQHLINWSVTNNGPRSTVMETWIDEGLSMAAEFVYGGEQKDRVDYFNADPYETIVNGNNFFYWNINGNTWDNDVLADYATAYLFFRWLGIHGGGNGIYTSVLNAASSNFQAVTGAAASIA